MGMESYPRYAGVLCSFVKWTAGGQRLPPPPPRPPPQALFVSKAVLSAMNGFYQLSPVMRGDRPVYSRPGTRYKIQWSPQSQMWMLDVEADSAPYCVRGRFDMTVPLNVAWSHYQGPDRPPYPTVSDLTSTTT